MECLEVALATMKQMNLDESAAVKLIGSLDGLKYEEIYPFLEKSFAPLMLITGDWIESGKRGVDLYDQLLKFVQDKFYRARVRKDCRGWYIVVAAEPIT